MNLNKLNQEIKQKIKAHKSKIKTLNSKELLDYSIALNRSKEDISLEVRQYLLLAIDNRKEVINSNSEVKEQCKMDKMVREFKRKGVKC
jgi:hypothetical protein